MEFTYDKNIRKNGETLRGISMYDIIDQNGKTIPISFARSLDYVDAKMTIDWINEDNSKPYGMSEILNYINKEVTN